MRSAELEGCGRTIYQSTVSAFVWWD